VSFLLGLCGSGKSHLADELARHSGAKFIDSLLADQARISLLIDSLSHGQDCLVEEAAFCTEAGRRWICGLLEAIPDLEIDWICFENDVEAANWNVVNRLNKSDAPGHLEINRRLTKEYTYPSGVTPRSIHRVPARR